MSNFLQLTLMVTCFAFCGSRETVLPSVQRPDTVVAPDPLPSITTVRSWLVDKNASQQTAALFYNLKRLAKTNVLFGHQDDTKRGVVAAGSDWANEQQFLAVPRDRSDVAGVTGAFPAVYGHDFMHIADFSSGAWYDYEAKTARELTIDAYNRGGVNTYAWHYWNPVSKADFYWEKSPVEAVSQIIPGGPSHSVYRNSLKEVADYAKTLVGADGNLVPVIFRPFHEFDGDWFWWGKAHCSVANYKLLYQFTVRYLRDSLGVRNFLYAWSPDKNFTTREEYLERYPGDEYVDLVGSDNYGDLADAANPSVAAAKFKIVSDYGKANNKLAAMTETGSTSNLAKANWYTANLLAVLKLQQLELAYALVWANTKNNFYTPYKGHPAEADFKTFKADPYLMFGDKVSPGALYQIK
jgi:mannan endo-1,4-beta-mannosidase